jgi:hypothetical protein
MQTMSGFTLQTPPGTAAGAEENYAIPMGLY